MTEEKITWELLCELEPRLLDLLDEVQSIKDDKTKPSFCANAIWYGYHGHSSIRNRMHMLVGSKASGGDPRLHDFRAEQVALHKLYDELPPCRNCFCM